MPEGDTIFTAAGNLRKVLCQQTLTAVQGRPEIGDVARLQGRKVDAVEARGKHLLLHIQGDLVLHSHLGMTGSWHIYRPKDAWHKPATWAAIQLATDRYVVVCFTPRLLQLVTATQLARDPWLQRLGPDILGPPIADDVFLARMRSQRDRAIGEAVMNQTVVCGIGNVYKSEILFLEGVHPQAPVSSLSDECLLKLRDQAVFLMRRNLDAAPRRTRFRADALNLWVYGRQSQECLKCGTVLQLLRQGETNRSTCFCPTCQPR